MDRLHWLTGILTFGNGVGLAGAGQLSVKVSGLERGHPVRLSTKCEYFRILWSEAERAAHAGGQGCPRSDSCPGTDLIAIVALAYFTILNFAVCTNFASLTRSCARTSTE